MSDAARTSASDIRSGGWLDRHTPPPLRPYARLARIDRPIGTWLLLFPCWWGVALATAAAAPIGADDWPNPSIYLLFAIGALVMRGAGCTFNDIADRDFDKRVARTADRPIASGAVSLTRAWWFLALLMLFGFMVLLMLNRAAIYVGLASLPLIFAYPFMKRLTYWPQAFLGITFNWGALVGWAAGGGGMAPAVIALYAAGIAWTLGYDTIYAHQDKEDDLLVGIKSTALLFGERTRPWLWLFYGTTVGLMAVTGLLAAVAWPYYLAVVAVALQLGWQAARVRLDDPGDCLAKFRSNRLIGWLLLAGTLAAALVARG